MSLPPTLLDLLSNSLVFNLIIPGIPAQSILALAATSRAYRVLLKSSPDTFRFLDLSVEVYDDGSYHRYAYRMPPLDRGGFVWRSQPMDENLTEEEFSSGPLRGIFYNLEKQDILRNVSTLVLDGRDVTVSAISDILLDTTGRFNVRVLSVRMIHRLLNEDSHRLAAAILRAVQPDRQPGFPRVKALYLFGVDDLTDVPGDTTGRKWLADAAMCLSESGDEPVAVSGYEAWYLPARNVLFRPIRGEPDVWPHVLSAASGIIHFDGVACRGPRHGPTWPDVETRLPPRLATNALAVPCMGCGTSPEGPATYGSSPTELLPLLPPPRLTPASVEVAKRPTKRGGVYPPLYARCETCILNRRCAKCRRWVCESCAPDRHSVRDKWLDSYSSMSMGMSGPVVRGGYVYDNWRHDGRSGQSAFSNLCLERCMPVEFAEGVAVYRNRQPDVSQYAEATASSEQAS
ncbi:hypothetical protein Dda_0715 [Drechslerella dactyloides]|uniref:Uncharacterized protein n=1 Tax=Drechslerella dactyloides TaxID=74499 RepID=A0AAD6J4S3_DREDA|nr:hypothetical protein Dda_0715 [Drechslerella dactyloides]